MDTIIALAEERGVRASGTNTDMSEFGPQAYVLSVIHSFVEKLKGEVGNLVDGTWEGNGEYRIATIEDGDMDIVWGTNVPQDVIDSVESVFNDMAGGWTPFTGPIYDNEGNEVLAEGEVLTDYDIFWGVEYIIDGVIRTE